MNYYLPIAMSLIIIYQLQYYEILFTNSNVVNYYLPIAMLSGTLSTVLFNRVGIDLGTPLCGPCSLNFSHNTNIYSSGASP